MKKDQIQPYIEKGLVSEQVHPEDKELKIYNYTPRCQFDRAWDEITKQCRGLILRGDEVVARPFPKFFNYGEVEIDIPNEEPKIYEKLDGSLGILYWLGDKPWIATRGSFMSEQAQWATKWFRENVTDFSQFDRAKTYLFEIIYPENRIVVNYGFSGLVFLAARDIKTGEEYWQTGIGAVRYPKEYPPSELEKLKALEQDNAEGFVVLYPYHGVRIKFKFDEYVRLHKILTGLSAKGVWEYLKEHGVGADIRDIVEDAPDEFYGWLEGVANTLKNQYLVILRDVRKDFNVIPTDKDRREMAEYIKTTRYPGILFAMLDNKKYDDIIWKMIKPRGDQTFQIDIDG